MDYEVLDISGDVGIKAYGESCGAAFVSAGLGMYGLITNVEGIDEKQNMELEAVGDSLEGLLVNYLNELIFRFDTYGFVGRRMEVSDFSPTAAEQISDRQASIKVMVYGEEFDPERHERRLLIKAATYHNVKVEEIDGTWEIDVIFDI